MLQMKIIWYLNIKQDTIVLSCKCHDCDEIILLLEYVCIIYELKTLSSSKTSPWIHKSCRENLHANINTYATQWSTVPHRSEKWDLIKRMRVLKALGEMASPDFNPFGLFSDCYCAFTASKTQLKPPVWLFVDFSLVTGWYCGLTGF